MSDDPIDSMPITEEGSDRTSLDNVVPLHPCVHPWLESVCTDCGLVLGPAEMHPEER